jgi:hypothetical protein
MINSELQVSGHPSYGTADKRLGIGNASRKACDRAFFWVAHGFELVNDKLLDGFFSSKADQLLFAINDQISDLGHAMDAFHDGIFAATAFDVFNFNLKSLSHFVFLSEAPLPSKNGGRV